MFFDSIQAIQLCCHVLVIIAKKRNEKLNDLNLTRINHCIKIRITIVITKIIPGRGGGGERK